MEQVPFKCLKLYQTQICVRNVFLRKKALKCKTTWRMTLFKTPLQTFHTFLLELKRKCVSDGGERMLVRWKGGSLSFQKGTKQEAIPLFWLVVGTSAWNFEEVEFTGYAHVSTQVRACTHRNKCIHTQWRECVACLSRQGHRDRQPPVDVMRSDY